jgi:hypothetical protein
MATIMAKRRMHTSSSVAIGSLFFDCARPLSARAGRPGTPAPHHKVKRREAELLHLVVEDEVLVGELLLQVLGEERARFCAHAPIRRPRQRPSQHVTPAAPTRVPQHLPRENAHASMPVLRPARAASLTASNSSKCALLVSLLRGGAAGA